MKILVDSDALFGLFVPSDAHHQTAKQLFHSFRSKGTLWVTNLVFQETATVISHKLDQAASLRFVNTVGSLELVKITISEEVERKAWNIFKQQTKKGTSFIDCANLAAIEQYKLDSILSFDTFYPKKLRVG